MKRAGIARFLFISWMGLLAFSFGIGAGESERIELGVGAALEIVSIPEGEFFMGSPAEEKGRNADEDAHAVRIASSFLLSKFPITRGQFEQFVAETRYKTEAEVGASGGFGFDGTALVQKKEFNWRNPGFSQTAEHPVVLVTYADAQAFCKWVTRKTGRVCSLPTEAQWEYACRAGTTTRFYSGDADADAAGVAWFKANAGNGTRAVGALAANAFGLQDMSGNVYQWCETDYAAYVPGGGVQGPMDKPRKVLRGGSWLKDAKHVRSAARARNTPGSRNADNGFRVVVGPAPVVAPPVVENPAVTTPQTAPAAETPPSPEPSTLPARTSEQSAPAAQSSGGTSIAALVMLVIVLLMVFFVAWFFYALLTRSNVSPPAASKLRPVSRSLQGAAPRVVDDGFWFDTSGHKAGDVVTYSYRGPQGMVAKEFTVEPSPQGQFIYTGVRPMDIAMGVAIAAAVASQMQQPPQPPPPQRRDDDDRFRGYPSAY